MDNSKKYLIFAVGIVLFIGLLCLPKTPKSVVGTQFSVEQQTQAALVLLQEKPMEAIQKLLALTEQFPEAWEPYFELAKASEYTGQYDKARQRYQKALELLEKKDTTDKEILAKILMIRQQIEKLNFK